MAKAKKTPQYQYGIEITKPHSKAMYDHNDKVAEVLKSNITKAWNDAFKMADNSFIDSLEEDQQGMLFTDSDWSNANQVMQDLSKGVTVTGYGSGFTVEDVQDDFNRDLECMENWQLHETYAELRHDGLVPMMDVNVGFGAQYGAMMVGFNKLYVSNYCSVYNTYDCYEDQLTDEMELAANPNYVNPNMDIVVPCSAELDQQMANESENIQ